MTVRDIHTLLLAWAPKEIAWEKDNIGLQVGDAGARVSAVCVSLDVTERVIAEAGRKRANLLVSHHPLLFRPPKAITQSDPTGRCVQDLVRRGISLLAAHTNLDFTRGGTSFALAAKLGLRKIEFLHRPYRVQKKIVTFVPESHLDRVRDAMAAAGAGVIGNYDYCSFTTPGTGSFRGSDLAHPAVGKAGRLEFVSEARLEMLADEWNVQRIIEAMKAAHPYEEVAYDIYPLENRHGEYGMGIVGELARPMTVERFLRFVKTRLGAGALRYSQGRARNVRRVAACGGSGAELAETARACGADAFITADVKYHDFHRWAGEVLLIDAGHFETERPVVECIVDYLRQELAKRNVRIPVFAAQTPTNPVSYI